MANHPNRNLTAAQRKVLESGGAHGVCIRYVWTWLIDGKPVTAQVKALMAKGYMTASYYSGGVAGTSVTDAGKAALAQTNT